MLFEKATREQYRFNYKGLCSVEDLWELPLEALDTIFKHLNKVSKTINEESLLATKSKEDEKTTTKIEIVKHIVKVKIAEQKVKTDKRANAMKKQKLLEILAKKQDKSLDDLSVDELNKMIDECN